MHPIEYRILLATPADQPTIERIAKATWPHTFGDILSADQIEYMLGRMYGRKAHAEQVAAGHVYHLLLVPDDDAMYPENEKAYAATDTKRWRAIGYVSHQLDYLPGTTKLHKIYLLPGSQGKGYGKLLVRKVERIARRAGQQSLRLDVNYQNSALHFYERLGFQKIGRHDTDIGRGYRMEDWQLRKDL